MDWDRHSAFGYDMYEFHDDNGKYLGCYVPKRDKISIVNDLTKQELEYIYNVIKNR